MDRKKALNVIIGLCVVGFFTAIYMLYTHYAPPSEGSFCDFSSAVSCSVVNTSVFSELFSVPVSLFGGLWFIFLGLMSWKAKKNDGLIPVIVLWNILGILFVVYLIVAEIILQAICPTCTLVHIITIITLTLSIMMYKQIPAKHRKQANIIKVIKPWLVWIVIINLIPLVVLNVGGENEDHTDLAKCITAKEVNMYGSFRCGVCAKTRAMFGDSFEYINEIECHPQGQNPQTELCISKDLQGTPTWILEPNGKEEKRYTGFLNIEELKEFSGCIDAS
jgi:uncharacterized membrane protein